MELKLISPVMGIFSFIFTFIVLGVAFRAGGGTWIFIILAFIGFVLFLYSLFWKYEFIRADDRIIIFSGIGKFRKKREFSKTSILNIRNEVTPPGRDGKTTGKVIVSLKNQKNYCIAARVPPLIAQYIVDWLNGRDFTIAKF